MIGYSDTFVWILPAIICLGVPITFFLTYGLAVSKNHVFAYWPYVSETGTLPPESCIFGFLLNIGSFILAVIMYIRYRQIKAWMEVCSISPCINKLSFVLGLVSCLGLNVVANFQQTNVIVVHLSGAFVCFIVGNVYFVIQTVYTRKINKSARCLFITRATLSVISSIAIILCIAPVYSAVTAFNGESNLYWTPKHEGYSLHILSTSMEWIVAFCFCMFIGTFFFDFRNIKISEPELKVLNLRRGKSNYGRDIALT